MGKLVSDIFTYINEILPNAVPTTTIYTFFNDECKKYWKYLTDTTQNTTVSATTQTKYSLPTTNIHFWMLRNVFVADSTASSDTVYSSYSPANSSVDLPDNSYYDAKGGKVGLSFNPTSDEDDFPIIFEYQEPPLLIAAASDTTTITNFDDDLTEVIVDNICAKIAKYGKFPRVNLTNNYRADGFANEKQMRLRNEQKKVKDNPAIRWDWRDWM